MSANIALYTNRNQTDRDSREGKKKEEGKDTHVGASRWRSRGRGLKASGGREETAQTGESVRLRACCAGGSGRRRRLDGGGRRPIVPSCGWSSTDWSVDLGPTLNGFLRVMCLAGRFRRCTWAMIITVVVAHGGTEVMPVASSPMR
jgi:hypothetical protein